jgi:hypothetical protein
MYRHGIDGLLQSLTERIPYRSFVRRQTYPGAFRWRNVPDFDPDWINNNPAWIVPPVESISLLANPTELTIPRFDLKDPFAAQKLVLDLVREPIENHLITRQFLSFKVVLSPEKQKFEESVASLINRCWDGLRVFPYPSREIISSIALTIVLLCARVEGVEEASTWPEILWGGAEVLEIAPVGGHLESGKVSKASLASAFSQRYVDHFTRSMRRLFEGDPRSLMTYVVDPWILFDFRPFRKMFVEEFIPTAVSMYWGEDLQLYGGTLECLWSPSFNPALLGFVTDFDYRFRSPLAHECEVERLILITPEMEREDLAEVFASCMPSILAHSKPFQIRFQGYSMDPRPLWKIERALEQAKWILDVAGISVLEVTTASNAEVNDPIQKHFRPMGAFEIWLLAREYIEAIQTKTIGFEESLEKEFWSDLLKSNEKLESAARALPDWPGISAPTMIAETNSADLESVDAWISNFKAPPRVHKVGRNEPCPCGSGLKYKKCCGK